MRQSLWFLLLVGPLTAGAQSTRCPLEPIYEFIAHSIYKDTVQGAYNTKVIRPGNGYIFRYIMGWDCPDLGDDENSYRLKWSIPDTADEFTLVFQLEDSIPPNITWDYST